MTKIRALDATWLERLSVLGLSRGARWLYVSAVAHADDEGLIDWSAPVVQEFHFSGDADVSSDDVAGWMGELHDRRLVLPYEGASGAVKLGWIVHFTVTQKVKRRARSLLPAPSLGAGEVFAAYLHRDKGLCHLCGRRVPEPGVFIHERLTAVLDALEGQDEFAVGFPSMVAVAHAECARAWPAMGLVKAREVAREDPPWARALGYPASMNPLEIEPGVAVPVGPSDHSEGAVAGSPEGGSGSSSGVRNPPPVGLRDSSTPGLRESEGAGLRESEGAAHPEHSGSTTGVVGDQPLTCGNASDDGETGSFSGRSGSPTGVLPEGYAGERNRKGKELEKETDLVSASRSQCDPTPHPAARPEPVKANEKQAVGRRAFGASKEASDAQPASPSSVTNPEATEETQTNATHPPASQAKLSDQDASLTSTPNATAGTQEESMTDIDGDSQDALFGVSKDMVREQDGRKKPAEPKHYTAENKENVKDLMTHWMENYADGHPQGPGVIYKILMSVLANKVKPEEIKTALDILGPQRKPISGGTIAFALTNPPKAVTDDRQFERVAASRDPGKYKNRTM